MSVTWGQANSAGRSDEDYPLADYRDVIDLLRQGRPYVSALDDDDIDPADESLLRRLNKFSELAVPVMYEGTMWGELWASGADGRRFSPDDVALLQAIATQISVAIGTTRTVQRGVAVRLPGSPDRTRQSTKTR